jgi:hypothetical protein
MPKYRIEMREQVTTSRETWIDAPTASEARAIAEASDWREWSEIETPDTDCEIVAIEDEDGNVNEDDGDEPTQGLRRVGR